MTTMNLKAEAWNRIKRERRRQTEVEGYDVEHDDAHYDAELERAAVAYEMAEGPDVDLPEEWPWPTQFWKPRNRAQNLERAGALFLAEADRLVRRAAMMQHMAHLVSTKLADVLEAEG